jgi:homoaconitate hydratase
MTLDHDVQNRSEANLLKYKKIEEFAKSQGVDFYPAGRGIGHQVRNAAAFFCDWNSTPDSDRS